MPNPLDFADLVKSGAILVPVALWALIQFLRGKFVTPKELNGLGARVNRIDETAGAAIELARANQRRCDALDGTIRERLVKALDEMRTENACFRREQRVYYERQATRDGDIHDTLLLHAVALRAALKRDGVGDAELPPLPARRQPA